MFQREREKDNYTFCGNIKKKEIKIEKCTYTNTLKMQTKTWRTCK